MEVYAAMVDDMDRYIGEVFRALRDLGEFDNTVVVFMSDNGAEGGDETRHPLFRKFVAECCDNSYDNLGRPGSFVFYGREWARVSNVPNRFFKSTSAEGGIRTPAIISLPGGTEPRRHDGLLSVMDLAPTVLDLAGVERPGEVFDGRPVHAMQGRSFRSVLEGSEARLRGDAEALGFEQSNHRALIRGPWKIAQVQPPNGDGHWKLFNLDADRSESTDLSQARPELFRELLDEWEAYAIANGVVSLDEIRRQRPPVPGTRPAPEGD